MLNTNKLLYILPDLAYIAELLPAKKEYTFTIHSFRQINGDFIDENELMPTSIEKLFTKLDQEEYHLILPDFLFTNTIVTVAGTAEATVLEHVNKKLLPDLDLSKETHELQITVLTSFKGNSKVQISAIEKSVLAPLRAAASKSETTITAVSPLTWAVKAIISLEPSISILQIGSQLYTALHYIGVDQANNFPMDDFEAISETVKTLKGSEPSVQSVYLASSSLVEEAIKEKLSGTLPIQQLVSFKEEDSQMPSYTKFIIESTMRTLSIPDFPVPQFKLGKASKDDLLTLTEEPKKTLAPDEDEDESEVAELPPPTKKEEEQPEPKSELEPEESKPSSKTVVPAPTDLPAPALAPAAQSVVSLAGDNTESTSMTEKTKKEELDDLPEIPELDTQSEVPDLDGKEEKEETAPVSKKTEIDLSQFASKEIEEDPDLAVDTVAKTKSLKDSEETTPEINTTEIPMKNLDKPEKKVIKNSSGVNNMLKMVFITIAVFFITIAIGVGVGLGLLKMSENKTAQTSPTVVTETPVPTATPTPTPELAAVDKETIKILIVNATTKAGYAGKIKTLLTNAEITNVDAGNAKGEYEASADAIDFILMKEENASLQKLLEESTELTFEYSKDIATEDPTGKYDAVIVLVK